VAASLTRMAEATDPLVRELPRAAGERHPRWTHLLDAAEPTPAEEVPPVEIDLSTRDARVRASYGTVTTPYAEHLVDELDGLPLERWLLDRVVALADGAPVVEAGCGPGHVTAYLADAGATATGIDLTPEMVAEAQRRFPQATYDVGDLRRLMRPPAADGWGAVLAWYSLVHTTPAEMPEVLSSLVRPLRPGGWLVYAGHAGSEVVGLTDWFERDVELEFVQQEPAAVAAQFEAAGLADVEWYRRGPATARGESTERAYVLGRRPAR
jgi:uncharacterized protein